MLETLFKGIIIGMIVSAPLGPVGVLCLRETLYGGRKEGMLTGLGAMLSDVIYAGIVYMSVGMVLDFVVHYDAWLRLLGGVIIVGFAYYLYKQSDKPVKTAPTRRLSKKHGAGKVITAFLVTLSNPFIMLLMLPLYARFQLVQPSSVPGLNFATAMLGIGMGCMLWWMIFTYWVRRMATTVGERGLRWISITVAAILAIIGLFGLVSGIDTLRTGNKRSMQLMQLTEITTDVEA